MSVYRARVGDRIVEVEGLPGLIGLVRAGELKPEDPVFIPSTGKWHYARSVRQLREHFPGAEAAPPGPRTSAPPASRGAEKQPGDARPGTSRPAPRPGEETNAGTEPESSDEAQSGATASGLAEVVPFRRGRWTPAGKGLEVPVFAYDVDLDGSGNGQAFRLAVLLAVGVVVVAAAYVYVVGYGRYQASLLDKVEDGQSVWAGSAGADAVPEVAEVAPASDEPPEGGKPARATAPDAASSARSVKSAAPTRTPAARVSFDAADALARVRGARVTAVRRPDELGDALRADLLRIAVPLRAARFVPDRTPRKARVAPFVGVLEWTAREDAAAVSRQRFMVVAMAGRRIDELDMNVSDLVLRSVDARGKSSETRIPAELAVRLWRGEADPGELERRSASR